MNSVVGGPACGWVPKDGSAMGEWVGWRRQWVGVWDAVGRWWVVFFVFVFVFCFGGYGLIFMGCDRLMLVGGGGCGLNFFFFF